MHFRQLIGVALVFIWHRQLAITQTKRDRCDTTLPDISGSRAGHFVNLNT